MLVDVAPSRCRCRSPPRPSTSPWWTTGTPVRPASRRRPCSPRCCRRSARAAASCCSLGAAGGGLLGRLLGGGARRPAGGAGDADGPRPDRASGPARLVAVRDGVGYLEATRPALTGWTLAITVTVPGRAHPRRTTGALLERSFPESGADPRHSPAWRVRQSFCLGNGQSHAYSRPPDLRRLHATRARTSRRRDGGRGARARPSRAPIRTCGPRAVHVRTRRPCAPGARWPRRARRRRRRPPRCSLPAPPPRATARAPFAALERGARRRGRDTRRSRRRSASAGRRRSRTSPESRKPLRLVYLALPGPGGGGGGGGAAPETRRRRRRSARARTRSTARCRSAPAAEADAGRAAEGPGAAQDAAGAVAAGRGAGRRRRPSDDARRARRARGDARHATRAAGPAPTAARARAPAPGSARVEGSGIGDGSGGGTGGGPVSSRQRGRAAVAAARGETRLHRAGAPARASRATS